MGTCKEHLYFFIKLTPTLHTHAKECSASQAKWNQSKNALQFAAGTPKHIW